MFKKFIYFCAFLISLLVILFWLIKKSNKTELNSWCGVMEIEERDSFYVHLLSNVESDQSYKEITVVNFNYCSREIIIQ